MARDVDASDLMPVSRERGPHGELEQLDLRHLIRAGAGRAAAGAAGGRRAARPAGVLVSGNRRPARACRKAPSSRGSIAAGSSSPASCVVFSLGGRRPAGLARRNRMNVTTSHIGGVVVLRVQRAAADLSDPVGLRDDGDQPHRRRREEDPRRPHAGRLRRQRHDRLPHGSVPPGARPPAARSSSPACRSASRRC